MQDRGRQAAVYQHLQPPVVRIDDARRRRARAHQSLGLPRPAAEQQVVAGLVEAVVQQLGTDVSGALALLHVGRELLETELAQHGGLGVVERKVAGGAHQREGEQDSYDLVAPRREACAETGEEEHGDDRLQAYGQHARARAGTHQVQRAERHGGEACQPPPHPPGDEEDGEEEGPADGQVRGQVVLVVEHRGDLVLLIDVAVEQA